ncbi:MAG: MFS transporter [Chloroflexi bacterium]|nr:MFS transporter [Chloroflexota bacterium]
MTTEPVSPTTQSTYDSAESQRGARLMLREGGILAVANAAWGYFTSAFAIRLGATSLQMGLFSATTQIMIASSQLSVSSLVGLLGGRKRMVVTTVLLSALPWLLLALVPIIPERFQVWSLIPLAGLTATMLVISDPAWGSWMSDLVPVQRRGSYMGLRGSFVSLVTMVLGMAGALALDRLHGAVMWGFTVVFLTAMASRLVSGFVFSRIIDPRPDLQIRHGTAPWKQLVGGGQSKLGRYDLFILVFHFTMGVGGPFLSIYLLRDVGVSYTTFVGLSVAESMAGVLVRPLWGHLADVRGNRLVLALAALGVATWPFLFILSAQSWYLWMIHPLIGLATAGWSLVAYNFVLENSQEEERASSVGFFNAMASAGIFGGALVGGTIAAHLPTIFEYQLMTLFLVSGILRLTSLVIFLPRVDESEDRITLRRLVASSWPRALLHKVAIWRWRAGRR